MGAEHPLGAGRETVLTALRATSTPMTVSDLSEVVGLHANTVRGHVEVLVHLGLVSRDAEVRTERGRPRILYTATAAEPAKTDAYRTLATVLANELSMVGPTDQSTADQAGISWAEELVAEGRLTTITDPDRAVSVVARLFDELGFDTATEPLGDRLYLQTCPYVAIRATFPGVCELHLGLLRGALAATKSGLEVTRLDVEPRPGLCMAQLSRTPSSRTPSSRTPSSRTPSTASEEPA
jgi:predicted ArsR family transcriptional regulator